MQGGTRVCMWRKMESHITQCCNIEKNGHGHISGQGKEGEIVHKSIFQSAQLHNHKSCIRMIVLGYAFYTRDDPEVRLVVQNTTHALVSWFAGYPIHVRKYTREAVRPLVGSFDIQGFN